MPSTTRAAIAADSPLTAAAGARIAREGGNVVDIAVAAALTATVAEPLMCSLGGSGFFMVRLAGQAPQLIEGADAMPSISEPPAKESDAWRTAHLPYGDGLDVKAGHAAVAVPGVLAAAEAAWEQHGRLPWREIVAPAAEVARSAFSIGATLAKWLAMVGRALFWQQDACRQCFFTADGPLRQGQQLRIANLEDTLAAVAEQGADALYRGDLSAPFADEIQEHGGFVTRGDLASYRPVRRKPILLNSGGFQLALNPPPAVGGAAVGCLIRLLEANWSDSLSAAERALLHARAQVRLLGVRDRQLAGAKFDEEAARVLLAAMGDRRALKSPNTTHLSVVDADGGMAAVTMSMGYGSGVIVPGLGIACNNSLGEPELNPQGFHVAPQGTRLVSNMAPTLAWHPHDGCLAFGSPGASRITTSIAQTWARFALEGLSCEQAVVAPRLHIEPIDGGLRAQFEPGIDASMLHSDFVLRPFDQQEMYFGAIKLAALDAQGRLHAVADERRHGATEIVER